MPSRILKETIRTSKSVNAMSDFQFRMWIYLITYVDDYGRGSADPEILKGFVFPRLKRLRESDIEKTLAELADLGSIHLYTVDGEPYMNLPNWSAHQRIQTKKSRFPAPPTECDDIPRQSTVAHGEPPSESNPIRIQSESNPKPKRPRADDDGNETMERYLMRTLNVRDTRRLVEEMDSYLEDGITHDMIRRAVEIADDSNARSWKFVKGVLDRWLAAGCRSLDDALAADEAFKTGKARASPPSPQQPTHINYDFPGGG